MLDLIFLFATLAFFAVSVAYAGRCEHLRVGRANGGKHNA